MQATLLLLELALANWREWSIPLSCQPKLCRQLPGGQSNQTFLLNAGDTQLVLRLGLAEAERLGVNRQTEQKILLAAAKAGLAPKTLYAEADSGLLVTEYLEGIKPEQDLLSSPQWQTTLARTIRSLRELSVDLPPYPYRQQIENYWQQLLSAGHIKLEKQYRKAVSALELLETSRAPLSLVHHDLSAENLLLADDRLILLDWEYAGKGYTIMDDVALLRLELDLSSNHTPGQWAAAQNITDFLDNAWYLLR